MKSLFHTFALVCIFNLNAQLTFIPDDAFEAYLETNIVGMSNGLSNDNYVNTSAVASCGQLDINGSTYPVSDLTGISEFSYLKLIKLSSIPMSIIDISNVNSQPWQIQILGSPLLTSIKLPASSEYSLIDISFNNQLNNITFNPGASLSVAPNLVGPCFFTCSNNNSISKIDLSGIQITDPSWLQIVNNPNLVCLNLQNGDCVMWGFVQISANNSLSCIQVDDLNYSSTAANWNVTSTFPDNSYSLNCPNCIAEVDSYEIENLIVYPNPTNSTIEITCSNLISPISYVVSNQLGEEILQDEIITLSTVIDLDRFPKGLYYIKIGEFKSNIYKIQKQ